MALQNEVVTPHGVKCSKAYHRIADVTISKDRKGGFVMTLNVHVYVDKKSREAHLPPITGKHYRGPFDVESSDNALTQAYRFLAGKDDYKGATDV